jgi:hypothetical protein
MDEMTQMTNQPQVDQNSLEQDFNLDLLAESWPSPIVARSEVGKFSGFLLNPRTLANLDSLNKGPGKIMVGNRACYSTRNLVAWMKNRQKEVV